MCDLAGCTKRERVAKAETPYVDPSAVGVHNENCDDIWFTYTSPASILSKSIAGRYSPVSYPDGPITARYRFIKNAYWVFAYMWFMSCHACAEIYLCCLYARKSSVQLK